MRAICYTLAAVGGSQWIALTHATDDLLCKAASSGGAAMYKYRWCSSNGAIVGLEERIFVSEILSHIGLVKDNDAGGILLSCIDGAPGGDAKAERGVAHAEHHDARMFRSVVGDPSEMRLDDVVAVEEGQLAVGLDPHLVLCVLREVVERGDVQTELARLGKLAKARAERHEVRACDRDGQTHRRFRDVVDAVAVEAEDVRILGSVDEVHEVLAHVVGELLEERLGLFFCERTHGG
ncbi:hypothetical protein L1887_55260 [Cichorium endivia]|nr:hypothetical protein L1887_55260 [Cichorium endivia]